MTNEKLQNLAQQMEEDSRAGELHRARSITVGTCFGGVTEIMMRGNNSYLWTPMQPVEVVELINQLAANIGCHVNLQPKKDFASWREWRLTKEEKEHLNGFPPFVNDMAPFMQVGTTGMDKELDKLVANGAKIIESGGGAGGKVEIPRRRMKNDVAIEETIDGRSIKRAATTA